MSRNRLRFNINAIKLNTAREVDEVYVLDDMNQSLEDILNDRPHPSLWTKTDKDAFMLYYVVCSRVKYKLHNATMLTGL